MLGQAVKGKEPVTVSGVLELAALELSLILPVWVVGALVIGGEVPSMGAMGVLAVGWLVTSVARHVVTRRRRRTAADR